MSIVICAVEYNRKFYIASDRRAIKGGVVNDDYQKIYEIRPHVYFAMTGIAEAGLRLLEHIRQRAKLPISAMIKAVDKAFKPNPFTLTIMIAGQDETKNYFIWQKNNKGEKTEASATDEDIAYSIGANDNIHQFEVYFAKQVKSGYGIEQAIVNTINYASTIDPTISKAHCIIKIGPASKATYQGKTEVRD